MLPAKLGFRMPPEWAEHQRTIMEWPLEEALWPQPFLEVLPSYAAIVNGIAEFEPVTLIVKPSMASQAAQWVNPKVEILPMEHNDSWARDNGPTMVVNDRGEVAAVNWIFNAWGGKYPHDADNLVAGRVARHLGFPCFDAPIVMEGGSIHVDGVGTLLTTEECLLNKNRNANYDKGEIETFLKNYLGIEKVIWLKRGLHGDDTDGHVDNAACFARPGTVLMQTCSDSRDPDYEISRINREILENATDAKGRPFRVIGVEQPAKTHYEDTLLTLSYMNFYFVNGGIILPVFGGESRLSDKNAVEVLREVFPDRRIAPVEGHIVARGGGNVHCLTQQVPRGKPAKL